MMQPIELHIGSSRYGRHKGYGTGYSVIAIIEKNTVLCQNGDGLMNLPKKTLHENNHCCVSVNITNSSSNRLAQSAGVRNHINSAEMEARTRGLDSRW